MKNFAISRVLLLGILTIFVAGCPDKKKSGNVSTPPKTTESPKRPLVPKTEIVDWCGEHGVPESICTRCNAELIAGFKKKGDWCKEHSLPESQCIPCHPELEAKFKAMAPNSSTEK